MRRPGKSAARDPRCNLGRGQAAPAADGGRSVGRKLVLGQSGPVAAPLEKPNQANQRQDPSPGSNEHASVRMAREKPNEDGSQDDGDDRDDEDAEDERRKGRRESHKDDPENKLQPPERVGKGVYGRLDDKDSQASVSRDENDAPSEPIAW